METLTMDAATRDQLAKVMAMTTSNHDAEALAAVRRANGILAKHQLTWQEALGPVRRTVRFEQPEHSHAWGQTRTADTDSKTWMLNAKEEGAARDICRRGLGPIGYVVISSQAVAFLNKIQGKLAQYAGAVWLSQKQWDFLGSIDEQLRRRGV